MSDTNSGCSTYSLAAGGLGNVMFCAHCGVITVVLQSVSIRFEPAAFGELTRMLGQARTALVRVAADHERLRAEGDPETTPGAPMARPLPH